MASREMELSITIVGYMNPRLSKSVRGASVRLIRFVTYRLCMNSSSLKIQLSSNQQKL